MEPLAAAKMKATTTVTLFIIIFLIAVWWSTVEVNAAEAAEHSVEHWRRQFEEFHKQLDKQEEQKLQRLDQKLENLQQHLDHRLENQKISDLLKSEMLVLLRERENMLNCRRERQRALRRLRRLNWQSDWQSWLNHRYPHPHPHYHHHQEAVEEADLDQADLEEADLEEADLEEAVEEADLDCCISYNKQRPRQNHMGNIWITVGFSTLFFFFMALTLRVFRDLEKQRKSCRKTHAFPVDDLGSVTNLLG